MVGSIYYYLIMFATLLFTFSFIPLVFEILQQKITSNIPYISLFSLLIALLIFLFIAIIKSYYIHSIFYCIGLLSIIIIMFLKKSYDNNTNIKEMTFNTSDTKNTNDKINLIS
jgi:uncharacterized protein with PQ loop repeat